MSIYRSKPALQDHPVRRLMIGALIGILSAVLLTCIAAALLTLQILPLTFCKPMATALLFIVSGITVFIITAGCTKKLLYGAIATSLLITVFIACNLLFAFEPLHLFSLLILGVSVITGAGLGVALSAWLA